MGEMESYSPEAVEVPDIPEVSEEPEISDTSEMLEVPEIPDRPEVLEEPEIPDTPEAQEVPEISDDQNVSGSLQELDSFEHAESAENRQSSDVSIEAPEIPEVNDNLDDDLQSLESSEAISVGTTYKEVDDSFVGPEKAEIYHSPETTLEVEPGLGPRPSFDTAPTYSPGLSDTVPSDSSSPNATEDSTSPLPINSLPEQPSENPPTRQLELASEVPSSLATEPEMSESSEKSSELLEAPNVPEITETQLVEVNAPLDQGRAEMIDTVNESNQSHPHVDAPQDQLYTNEGEVSTTSVKDQPQDIRTENPSLSSIKDPDIPITPEDTTTDRERAGKIDTVYESAPQADHLVESEQHLHNVEITNDSGLPKNAKTSSVTEINESPLKDEDIVLNEVQKIREQQKKELEADIEAFDNRPKPPSFDANLSKQEPHIVPATVIENLNTLVDEKKAIEIAKHEYPHKSIEDLADKNLGGVAMEGTVQRTLEDIHGADHVVPHPKDMLLQNGKPIEPDFVVTDDKGNPTEIVDAKGYTRKDTHNPEAAASSLTHMSNLEKTSRYTAVDNQSIKQVSFYMPAETATMKSVQDAVSNLGTDDRPLSLEVAGTEADLKQRMTDLRADPLERFNLSDNIESEISRIQGLPVDERRQAMGDFVVSLKDNKGDETSEGRNLRWDTRIERDGSGVTIIGKDGKEFTVWYK
jgi:hypothetical protein